MLRRVSKAAASESAAELDPEDAKMLNEQKRVERKMRRGSPPMTLIAREADEMALREVMREEIRAHDEARRDADGVAIARAPAQAAATELVGLTCPSVETSSGTKPSISGTELEDESALCVVCFDSPTTHVFAPCGHMACCGGCADRVMCLALALCPVCRAVCSHSLRVFRIEHGRPSKPAGNRKSNTVFDSLLLALPQRVYSWLRICLGSHIILLDCFLTILRVLSILRGVMPPSTLFNVMARSGLVLSGLSAATLTAVSLSDSASLKKHLAAFFVASSAKASERALHILADDTQALEERVIHAVAPLGNICVGIVCLSLLAANTVGIRSVVRIATLSSGGSGLVGAILQHAWSGDERGYAPADSSFFTACSVWSLSVLCGIFLNEARLNVCRTLLTSSSLASLPEDNLKLLSRSAACGSKCSERAASAAATATATVATATVTTATAATEAEQARVTLATKGSAVKAARSEEQAAAATATSTLPVTASVKQPTPPLVASRGPVEARARSRRRYQRKRQSSVSLDLKSRLFARAKVVVFVFSLVAATFLLGFAGWRSAGATLPTWTELAGTREDWEDFRQAHAHAHADARTHAHAHAHARARNTPVN